MSSLERFNRITISWKHAGVFALLLVVEVLIALYVHDRWIRPFIGDVLVVPLIYCFISILRWGNVSTRIISVLAFALLVELLQATPMVQWLGWEHHRFWRIILGQHFDCLDLLAYLMGGVICWLAEKFKLNQIKFRTDV